LHATGGENRAAMNEISFSFPSLSLYDSQGAFGDCQSMRKKKREKREKKNEIETPENRPRHT